MKLRPQFSIRALLLVTFAAAIVFWATAKPRGLRGTWTGTQNLSKITFRFDDQQVHITNRWGTTSTPYTLSEIGDTAAIDFVGDNGLQRGIYKIDADGKSLTLLVGNGYAQRPTTFDATPNVTKAGNQSGFARYMLLRQ